jgi:adenylylsulfate kinase-like enzyme
MTDEDLRKLEMVHVLACYFYEDQEPFKEQWYTDGDTVRAGLNALISIRAQMREEKARQAVYARDEAMMDMVKQINRDVREGRA